MRGKLLVINYEVYWCIVNKSILVNICWGFCFGLCNLKLRNVVLLFIVRLMVKVLVIML